MKTNYILLLPPSEGKSQNIFKTISYNDAWKNNSFQKLELARKELYENLIKVLSSAPKDELEGILELKGDNLQKAVNSNLNLKLSSTLPAIKRYSGVMFNSINYENMNELQKSNFNDNIIIIDGMFGILRPLDLIPDYKLKITSKFGDINVSKYWTEKLKDVLEKELKNKIIIDILPNSHRKVIDFDNNKNHYEIIFAKEIDGKMKNVGHLSKELKGEFVNFICSKNNIEYGDLINWEHSLGFSFSKKYSNENLIVYLKK